MIEKLLTTIGLDRNEFKVLQSIEKTSTNKKGDKLLLEVKCENLFSFQLYAKLIHHLKVYFQTSIELRLIITNPTYRIDIVRPYLHYLIEKNTRLLLFQTHFPIIKNNELVYFDKDIQEDLLLLLQEKLAEIGIQMRVVTHVLENEEIAYTPKVEKIVKKEEVKRKPYKNSYVLYHIHEIIEPCEGVEIEAEIFEIEVKTFKNGKTMHLLYVKDAEDAIGVKLFESKLFDKNTLEQLKVGMKLKISGKVENDMFLHCLTFVAEKIEVIEKKERLDNSKVKRVELHTHTKMSEMDGVSSVEEYIQTAKKWGHQAIAITDHSVVQSFPKAQNYLNRINSKENPMKLIYGVEMNMIESQLSIVRNCKDVILSDAKYCVLDLETTGLSTNSDHIIEFGGQNLDGLTIKDSLQLFVKSPVTLDSHITTLTNITDELLKTKGIALETAIDKILAFIGDRIIVAHNAEFDFSFLNDTLVRLGRKPLENPVIDTLDLARAILPDRKSYRLGNIARFYGITYDEEGAHRADYDTEVLAQVFIKMMENIPSVVTLQDLQNVQPENAFMKAFDTHVSVLVKNNEGLKDLFKLITLSHTVFLASVSQNVAVPKITRDALEKYRKHLLIGSACSNNEIFEYALHRSQERLEKAMAFYDYIEVQPRNCYRHLLRRKIVKSESHLTAVIEKIIQTAKKLNKIVVATSDAHYVHPEQKSIRDIYISAQAIGGLRHPLYIYHREERLKHHSYPQHLLTTEEMLEEFNYLGEALAYEIVVKNTNFIADSIEIVTPVKSKLYPPEIKDCDVQLKTIAYENAYQKYGNPLPEIVHKRLEKELTAIIGSGYHVVYYISHLLVKKSLEDGYLVGSRGSVGSSLVATMTNITEVNPLVAHYYCPNCCYSEFFEDGSVGSGYDLPAKPCPKCKTVLKGDGQDIPFETFLGFKGDKVPDIDLNFSSVYQPIAHQYTKEVFGEEYVFRAGTIGTVATKTAFGYIKGYQEEMEIDVLKPAQIKRLAIECEGVKRTTGQHPGGIIVIPDYMDVHDFTPVQYPANDKSAEWKTTHFEFHDIHDNVLKLDILGHVDPTAMRFLQNISGIDPLTIPMNDEKVMQIFSCIDSLNIDTSKFKEQTGAAGIPEFGTPFVRKMLEATKPTTFTELVQISGLSHGTDVWLKNAEDLIKNQVCTLKEVIGCRDDIMVYLIHKGLDEIDAFTIMESVRKGKGLKDEWIQLMKDHQVEDWYIESCQKIKYMFPKAHAAAYVLMAVRIAWFKVHYPLYYYCMFFSIRCDAYDIVTMIKGENAILQKMENIRHLKERKEETVKDNAVYATLELALEMYLRGYYFANIDLNLSSANEFLPHPTDPRAIIPPFTSLDGLGENVALSIVEARQAHAFISKEDLKKRTGLSTTLINKLDEMNVLDQLVDKNQMSLF